MFETGFILLFGAIAYGTYRLMQTAEMPKVQEVLPMAKLDTIPAVGYLDGIIPDDRDTWPTGDKIWDICQAIAIAEGYGPNGNNPTKLCNPGDISDGADTFGNEQHSGSKVTHFPDHATGWTWLYNKVKNASEGKSHIFLPTMTWFQFAQKYAGDWQNWMRNVTNDLGVEPSSTLRDYVNS